MPCLRKKYDTILIKICYTVLILSLSFAASAQLAPPDKIKSLTTDDGLPQGFVTGFVQDAKGFVWISTHDGFARYDGRNVKTFRHDEADSKSLSSNIIDRITLDHENHIWLEYENGQTDIFDPVTEKSRHLTQEKGFGWLSPEYIKEYPEYVDEYKICEDNSNRIYIISFAKKTPGSKLKYFTWKNPKPVNVSLPGDEFPVDMGVDKNNNLWVAGNKSLYISENHHPLKKVCALPPGLVVPFYYVKCQLYREIKMAGNAKLLCSNYLETWTYDIRDNQWQKIVIPPGILGDVNYFETARDGTLYFFSEKAIYRVDKNQNLSLVWINDTKYDYIATMIDRSNTLWVGTNTFGARLINLNNSGFRSYKYNHGSFFDILPKWFNIPINDKSPWRDSLLLQIAYAGRSCTDKNGNTWVINMPYDRIDGQSITPYSFVMLSKERANVHNINFSPAAIGDFFISDFTFDKKNQCWAILHSRANKDLLVKVDLKTNKFSDSIKIIPRGQHTNYVLAVDDGLCLVYPDALQFYNQQTHQSIFYKNQPGLNVFHNITLLMAVRDPVKKNILWLTTRGNGLIKFDLEKVQAIAITEKDGIPNNTVYAIVPDKHGYLWCSSNKGIFRFDPADNNVFSFTKKDGLQGNEFNRYQFLSLPGGHIAFGGTNGGTVFDPDSIKLDEYKPRIAVTDIMVNNNELSTYPEWKDKAVSGIDSLFFTYDMNSLTFHFAGLEYSEPEKLRYRYMLQGIDKKWLNSGVQNSANYTYLQPGSYVFKVNASNTSGIWSDQEKTIFIHITPPWWRSNFAYAYYFILLGLCITACVKFINNRARLKAQLSFEQLETKRIKDLDFAKTQFYTNISHEFRTPLTVILGMAQKIADSPKAYLKEGTEMIMRNGQSLLKLVNEMLDLSKLQSGKMVLNPVKGDIITFLRYIVESFHSLSENQKKQLHFLSELASYNTEYDPEKIRQIISNLLSNALKFTPEGGNIYISVNAKEDAGEENTNAFTIKIKDTGIGIPEDKLHFIFDRFYQVDNSSTRTTEGTGIGLSLTKELVKLMKGEISVKSPPPGIKKGTEFTVALPLKKLPASDETIAQPHLNGTDGSVYFYENNTQNKYDEISGGDDKRPLILLVEDNADVVAYTAFCLPDYRLAVAKDGMEGFEMAVEIIPDLIISDVMMPRLDGFQLLRKLKADEFTSHIPVIMLTAKADKESKMEGISEGADAYLEKPFNNEELQLRVKKLLELRKTLQLFYLKKAGLSNTPLSATAPDESPETVTTVTEDKFVIKVRELVEAHISDAEFSIEQLCGDLFMSHSKLHRKLDALTGCSPNKFVRIIRLKKAKQLLKSHEISIASIAIDCGFSDPGYFARVFKQEFGVTPNEWRTGVKEW
jgi:signal transduction histidine kinase/DNA-binding response OmpR family regulator